MAVKGSKFRPMRVIQHSPMRRFVVYTVVVVAFVVALPASYFLGIYRADANQQELKQHLTRQSEAAAAELTRELTLLRTNADVDRQTIEDLRQLVMTQRAQISAFERDLRVYKELLAPGGKTNPAGISVGVFTLLPQKEAGHFKYSFTVQKLSAKEGDFTGTLEFKITGQQAGKSQEIHLYQVSSQVDSPMIPLNFKYFQTLDGELTLPADFAPQNLAVAIKGSDKKNVLETQLEWPDTSVNLK